MHVIGLYKEIKRNPNFWMPKTTYIFGAKAAGTYYFAKKVIELINKVGKVIDMILRFLSSSKLSSFLTIA